MSFTLDDRTLFLEATQELVDTGDIKVAGENAVLELILKLNADTHEILINDMLGKMITPGGVNVKKNRVALKSFLSRLTQASKAVVDVEDFKAEEDEVPEVPVVPVAESVATLFAFGVRNIDTCCAAAIREPKGNAPEYAQFSDECTHFLRQCRRKPATEGIGCTVIPSVHKFCRQHICFQPKFVYTREALLPQPIDGSVLSGDWDGSNENEAGPVGNMAGNFLNHLDHIFRVSKADITSMDKKNKHQLDRFKQTVIENVKTNMDMLIQSARDNASGSALCDQDEESDLCGLDEPSL